MTSDAELLRRYAETRCESAFTEVVRRQLPLVYSAALRRMNGDAHAAADVTQQVFLRLAQRADRVSRHPLLAGWLYTTTRNAATDHARAAQSRRRIEQQAQLMNEPPRSPAPEIDWAKLRPELDRVVDQLGESERTAILLRYFEQRSFRDIGAFLRLSEDAARMRTERALAKLQALLGRRGIKSTSAALGMLLVHETVAAPVPASLAASVASAALAGVATTGAGGAAATFLTLMSTTKMIVGAAVVCGLAGLGSTAYQVRETRAARAAMATLRAERGHLRQQVARLEQQAADEARRVSVSAPDPVTLAARSSPAGTPASRPAAAAPGVAAPPTATNAAGPSALDLLRSEPDYQQASLKHYRTEIALNYGPLYHALRLSPQQIAAFEDTLVDALQHSFDLAGAAVAQGMSTTDPAMRQLSKPSEAAFAQKLRHTLGDAGAREYAAYIKTMGARKTANALAGHLYYSDAPLTLPQAEQLTNIIAANTTRPKLVGLYPEPAEVNWAAALQQAEGVLAPAQVKTLAVLQENARLMKNLSHVSAGLKARETAPPDRRPPGAPPGG